MDQSALKDLLIAGNYVTAEDYVKAETYATTHRVTPLDYLLAEKILTRPLLGQAIAESLKVPYADFEKTPATSEQVQRLPERFAIPHRLVLFREDDASAVIATDTLPDASVASELAMMFPDKEVSLAYALTEHIDAALLHYRKELSTRFADIIRANKRVAPEIIDQIVEDAIMLRASDIHFEPQETETLIRFRVDGLLQIAGRIPAEYYGNILNRIKIQARLRTDEHDTPQDGAIRFKSSAAAVDLRVSIAPTLNGEKIVIRLLGEYVSHFVLTDLGLSEADKATLLAAANKPFGMILVTGPTGSGKTTSLYALLRMFNDSQVNIMTIEDPVEYKIAGINQMQVNTAARLTFGRGLRSIVRQDPNIILVGEIRDTETAEISVNAALTGHLLFSTFHANDAATAVPRLLEMGVEPFLLASTLNLIVAQRLIRRLCESCRVSEKKTRADLATISPTAAPYFPEEVTLYTAKGCAQCNQTGFRGRLGVFELIVMTPALQELALHHASAAEISKQARQQGTRSLFEDGVDKVVGGLTTLSELLRVAEPPRP